MIERERDKLICLENSPYTIGKPGSTVSVRLLSMSPQLLLKPQVPWKRGSVRKDEFQEVEIRAECTPQAWAGIPVHEDRLILVLSDLGEENVFAEAGNLPYRAKRTLVREWEKLNEGPGKGPAVADPVTASCQRCSYQMSNNGVWASKQLWLPFHLPTIPKAFLVAHRNWKQASKGILGNEIRHREADTLQSHFSILTDF